MRVVEWLTRLADRLHERARRAEWERLRKQGRFSRGRSANEDGAMSQEGKAAFAGELLTRLIKKGTK